MSGRTISLADIESSARKVQARAQGKVEDSKQTLMTVAAAGGIVVLLLFFLLGKRSGKKKTTFVEIRRV
jgi:hypothetical protein